MRYFVVWLALLFFASTAKIMRTRFGKQQKNLLTLLILRGTKPKFELFLFSCRVFLPQKTFKIKFLFKFNCCKSENCSIVFDTGLCARVLFFLQILLRCIMLYLTLNEHVRVLQHQSLCCRSLVQTKHVFTCIASA